MEKRNVETLSCGASTQKLTTYSVFILSVKPWLHSTSCSFNSFSSGM
jgi:hypothetical protein